MGSLLSDIRYAIRSLARNPVYALVVVLTLALGIGATTAIFSVVQGVLLSPLPYGDADRLVLLEETRGDRNISVAYPNFEDYRDQSNDFERLAAYRYSSYNLLLGDGAERLRAYQVSDGFFDVLGVQPTVGRTLDDTDSDEPAVVLSHQLWENQFSSDEAVLGEVLRLDGQSFVVVGVMPPRFEFYRNADLWVPLAVAGNQEELESRSDHPGIYAVGRLRPGVDLAIAQTGLDAVSGRLSAEYPDTNQGLGVEVISLEEDIVGSDTRRSLWIFQGAVLLLLLIACANVASLLASRASVRMKEVAVRTALGARRGRLVRQFLTESLVLALLGGLLGLLLAAGALRLLVAFDPGDIPRLDEVTMDGTVVLFAFAVSLFSALLFGLVPMFQTWQSKVQDHLKDGSGGSVGSGRWHRVRQFFVVAEVALSLVLLTAAGLLLQSFVAILAEDPGLEPEGVVTANITLPQDRYGDWQDARQFFRQLLSEVEAQPGVARAAVVTPLPLSGSDRSQRISFEGMAYTDRDDLIQVDYAPVSPGYFETLGIPVLAGRTFFDDEGEGPPPTRVIVSRETAEELWPGQSPIGKRLKQGPPDGGEPWSTVVGMVGNVSSFGVQEARHLQLYYPYDHIPLGSATVVARAEVDDPMTLVPAIRREVSELDSSIPIYNVNTMQDQVDFTVAQPRFSALLLLVFAFVALLLSAIGVYGVVAYAVSQRTREIGLRMALGAGGGDIGRRVLRQALTPVVIGVVLGLLGSAAAVRLLESLLWGVEPTEPTTYIVVVVVLLLVGVLGGLLPALRATRVDPTQALRYD